MLKSRNDEGPLSFVSNDTSYGALQRLLSLRSQGGSFGLGQGVSESSHSARAVDRIIRGQTPNSSLGS